MSTATDRHRQTRHCAQLKDGVNQIVKHICRRKYLTVTALIKLSASNAILSVRPFPKMIDKVAIQLRASFYVKSYLT